MNQLPTFVFKMSRVQANLPGLMDENSKGMLHNEYCFADGTLKRVRDDVTLSAYVYVPLLRKMVKLATMEVESEHTSNWSLFWRFFNEVSLIYLSNIISFFH